MQTRKVETLQELRAALADSGVAAVRTYGGPVPVEEFNPYDISGREGIDAPTRGVRFYLDGNTGTLREEFRPESRLWRPEDPTGVWTLLHEDGGEFHNPALMAEAARIARDEEKAHEHGAEDCEPGTCSVAQDEQERTECETIARSGEDDEPHHPDLPPEWGPRYGPHRDA